MFNMEKCFRNKIIIIIIITKKNIPGFDIMVANFSLYKTTQLKVIRTYTTQTLLYENSCSNCPFRKERHRDSRA